MKIEIKSYSSSSVLIVSILFLILGTVLVYNANSIVTIISYIIGSFLAIIGLIRLAAYFFNKKKKDSIVNVPKNDLVLGIILLTMGISCFFLATIFELLIRFIVGAWILLVGLNRLIGLFSFEKKDKRSFLAILIVSVLLIAIGLFVILYSNIIFTWIGILMIIYSIIDIIGFIFFSHNATQKFSEKEKTMKDVVIIEHKEDSN